MGDLDDSAREGQERLRTAVLDALLAADSAANSGRVTGWLRKADMRDVLRGLLGAEAVAQQQKQRAAELAEAATAGAGAGVGGGGKAGGRASGAGEAQGAGAGAGGGGRAGGRTSGAGEAQAAGAGAGAEAAGGRECSGWLAVGLSGQQLDDLFDALDSEEPHEMVQYARLFEDDPGGCGEGAREAEQEPEGIWRCAVRCCAGSCCVASRRACCGRSDWTPVRWHATAFGQLSNEPPHRVSPLTHPGPGPPHSYPHRPEPRRVRGDPAAAAPPQPHGMATGGLTAVGPMQRQVS